MIAFCKLFKNLQQKLLLILYLALRYKKALNKIAVQSKIRPFLDIKFKNLRVYKEASGLQSLAFLCLKGKTN